MEFFHMGKVSIPTIWIAFLLAMLASEILYRMLTGKKTPEWYSNALFLYVMIWKFSYPIFHFQLAIQQPISILYFNGGIRGHFLALTAVLSYLVYITIKRKNTIDAKNLLLYFWLCFLIFDQLFNHQLILAIIYVLILISFIFYQKFYSDKKIDAYIIWIVFLTVLLLMSMSNIIWSVKTLSFIGIFLSVIYIAKLNKKG